MMKVAIVGSNGFIGRHLTERLLKEKNIELFLFGRSDTGAYGNELPYRKIDFLNTTELQKNFAGTDVVYYLASETIPATSWNNPILEIEKNLLPFVNFLEAISKLKIKKVAFISSAGTVYGATTGKVTEESDKQPFSPYGIIKLSMENFLNYYKVRNQIQFDVYRVSNVYGEGQNVEKGLGIINTFLEKIIRDKEVHIFGNGKSTRNYIYVRDVTEMLTLSTRTLDGSGIYNIASNNTLNIIELVGMMKNIVDEEFNVVYKESRQSDNSYIDLDNSRILKNFANFHFTDIKAGILKTYKALKNEKVKN